ncbi:MAG TPA: alkaline phosphatase family protein [Acidimicrobiales bacterium]|nr:alkaline phosphatase family protein [Acidimicrobiales bacterium]
MLKRRRSRVVGAACASVAVGALASLSITGSVSASADDSDGGGSSGSATTTPIKHLVVIFQENVSFDHYFATYPLAANLPGENPFKADPSTPTVNGLSGALLAHNPNLSNPQRLAPAQSATCDQDHGYTHEQQADDAGAMDKFVQDTGKSLTLQACLTSEHNPAPVTGPAPNYAVMDYYDGNTVTAMWNYAQGFAMSDNSWETNFGPSTPGAINVTGGNTFGVICGPSSAVLAASACSVTAPPAATPGTPASYGQGTNYSDADPVFDICSNGGGSKYNGANDIEMGGPNVGDLLSKADVTWGWFEGGFAAPGYVPGKPSTDPTSARCNASHTGASGSAQTDYIPHHEPFQYWQSTSNPDHTPPSSVEEIGTSKDGANHQYDLSDFWAAANSGDLPAVSYLKAPAYQDGHAGYSDPTLEQQFLADTINKLEKLPSWKSTAVVINDDDSDGWYDHQLGPIVSQSQTTLDGLTATGQCGSNAAKVPMTDSSTPEQARCGVGPRLPMLVISPFAKRNFVDNSFTSQTSIVRFIEDNWLAGTRIGNGNADTWAGSINGMFNFGHPIDNKLILNPATGEPQGQQDR